MKAIVCLSSRNCSVNEASGVANSENSEILKTRAIEPILTINPKGIQAFEIDNMCMCERERERKKEREREESDRVYPSSTCKGSND